MLSLAEHVRRNWPDLRGPGVVAVSGGADSVALLRCLAEWVNPLVAVHLNHCLRGADSDADEQFVRELSHSLNLGFRTISIDVQATASIWNANLEDTARKARYDWFAQVARETGANWIATGHTADDQAETVLHRLIRGAGIQGLRGIACERELVPSIRLVRPFLHVHRSDVIACLNALGQAWREDASNRDAIYTRNRIRHELLPLLKTFNPALIDVLGRLAEQAGEVHCEQQQAARELLVECELPRASAICVVQTARLRTAARHRIRGVLRLLWEREGWPQRDMTFEHWKRLVEVALGEESTVELPGGITARLKGNILTLGRVQRP